MKTPITLQFKPTIDSMSNINFEYSSDWSDSETVDIQDYDIKINLTFTMDNGVMVESPRFYIEMFSLTLRRMKNVKYISESYSCRDGWSPAETSCDFEDLVINQSDFEVELSEDRFTEEVLRMDRMFEDFSIYLDLVSNKVFI